MKLKIIALLLAAALIPPQVLAETEKGIDFAVAAAKAKLDIPEHYTDFYGQIEQDNTARIFSLSWSGEGSGDEEGGYASAKVDEAGRIIYYSHYKYGKFEGDYKLSALDYNGAAAIAADYARKICPEFAEHTREAPADNYRERNYNSYYVKFYRYENGIPYYNNYIAAAVSAASQKLTELVVKWDDIEQFPPGQGVLPPERAQALYRERLGVSPRYCDDDGGNPVLLYGANVTERTYINAFTGELTPTGIKNGGFATDISNAEKYMTVTDPTASGRDAEGAPPYERLADGVRSRLGIGEAYALGPAFSGAGYHSLTFVSRRDGIIEVVLDSETRDVLRYFKSHPADVTEQVSEAAAYEAARDFARRAAPVKYASCAGDGGTWYDAESYTITFPRVVNGIAYLDNGITVAGNAASGEVLSFTLQWTQSLFPSAANAAGEEAACDELFRRVGLELQYVAVAKRGVTRPRSVRDIELRLVYHFVPGKPLFVNAVTGRLSDARGNAYAGDLPSRYADVAGHPSEAYINALAPCGILSAGENFHPDDAITQAEYLTWLYRAVRQYDVTADELYNALIYGFRVIREEERNDDAPLVFRDAVKYLIRLLGYTDVAELEDTYQTGFVDEAAITPEYIGYAAIAKGLHIVKGNAFAPERRVTRATAAEIIYNLLTN